MDNIKNQFNNSTLNNPVFNYGTKSIKKHLGNLPILPEIFLGRADDLQKIHDLLFLGDNLLLLVNGVGGIGKTTVASYYYATYVNEYKHLAMVFAEKSIADALLSLAIYLEMEFEQNSTDTEKINKILLALTELEKPCLLIIDNANNLEDMDKWYPILRSCLKLHLLLTSRISRYENAAFYPVNALNDADAKLLFKKHYRNYDDSEEKLLESILVAVGYNTLVIELLAKNLNNFNNILRKNYVLSDLLKDIQKKGVLALTKSGNVKTDYKLKPAKPEEIVEAMYSVSELREPEKQLLSVLAVLPAEKIPYENIERLLSSVTDLDTLLLALAQKGWIEFDEKQKSFKCNPVIQEIVRKQNKNSLTADCSELVYSITDLLNFNHGTGNLINVPYFEGAIFARYAEMVNNWLFPFSDHISNLPERLGNFFATYGNFDKALKYFEDLSRIEKEIFESNPQNVEFKNNLAISYQHLGVIHTDLGNLDKALKFFEDYSRIQKELFESNPQNVDFKNGLAISYQHLGRIHTDLGNMDKAFMFSEDYLKIEKELFESNPQNVEYKINLAISYQNLGLLHSSLGNLDKALMYFEDDSRLAKELFESNPQNEGFKNGLAISYCNLGETYASLGNPDKALMCFEDDLKLLKELFKSNPQNIEIKNNLAILCSNLGETHASLGNLNKAVMFFEDYSRINKEIFESNPQNVEFKNGLAISYSKLGELYTDLDNLDKALMYFEDDLKLSKEIFESNPQNVEFKNGLAISYCNLGETYASQGNLNKAVMFFEDYSRINKEIFESNPQNEGFKNELAISYYNLGETHASLGNLNKALMCFEDDLKLVKELFEPNPQNIEIIRKLAVLHYKLCYTHTSLGNLDKALEHLKEYLRLDKELFEPNLQKVGLKNILYWLYRFNGYIGIFIQKLMIKRKLITLFKML